MRINVAVPEAFVKAPVINAALEATTKLNEELIKEGQAPLFEDALRRGLRWRPEPAGDEHFDHALETASRGWGDCDDLAPHLAADLRVTGKDPAARAEVVRSGPKTWHAIVRLSDGSIMDPSTAAGMHEYIREHGVSGVGHFGITGHGLPLMFAPQSRASAVVGGITLERPQLALRKLGSGWQSRADLPWNWHAHNCGPLTMASLQAARSSSDAVSGACHGLAILGAANDAPAETLAYLDAVADAAQGYSWEELADRYGVDNATRAGSVVGSFFGHLTHALTHPADLLAPLVTAPMHILEHVPGVGPVVRTVEQAASAALPMATKLANFIPGVGPLASMALQAASPMLQHALATGANLHPEVRAQQMAQNPGAAAVAPPQYSGTSLHCVPFG